MKRLLMILAILLMATTASAIEIPEPNIGDTLPVTWRSDGDMNAPEGIYDHVIGGGRLQTYRTQFSMVCEGQRGSLVNSRLCW